MIRQTPIRHSPQLPTGGGAAAAAPAGPQPAAPAAAAQPQLVPLPQLGANRAAVEAGEHITRLSTIKAGCQWQTLWDKNGSLQGKRKNAFLLFHGDGRTVRGGTVYYRHLPDIIEIPAKGEKHESGSTEAKHKFVVPVQEVFLRLKILDEYLQPMKNIDYTLVIEGIATKGKTSEKGLIEQSIRPSVQRGTLTLFIPEPNVAAAGQAAGGQAAGAPAAAAGQAKATGQAAGAGQAKAAAPDRRIKITYPLQIGRLDPIQEEAPDKYCTPGVQARLNNLGFEAGSVDGVSGPISQKAIKRFQRRMSLSETGQADDATQSALYKLHDTDQPGPQPKDLPPAKAAEKPAAAGPAAPAAGGGAAQSPTPMTAYDFAVTQTGTTEWRARKQDNPEVVKYFNATALKSSNDETSWCSAFVNWCAMQAKMERSNSAAARSWHDGRGVGLNVTAAPQRGDVVVFRRKCGECHKYSCECPPSRRFNKGHVAFFEEFADGGKKVRVLGGNQADPAAVRPSADKVCVADHDATDILSIRRLRRLDEKGQVIPGSAAAAGSTTPNWGAVSTLSGEGEGKRDPSALEVGFVAADKKDGTHFNTFVLRPEYQIALHFYPEDVELIFPESLNEDKGKMARLQALSYFLPPLDYDTAAQIAAVALVNKLLGTNHKTTLGKCLDACWNYFRRNESTTPLPANPAEKSPLTDKDAIAKVKELLGTRILEGGKLPGTKSSTRIYLPGPYAMFDDNSKTNYFLNAGTADETSRYIVETRTIKANKALGRLPLIASVRKRYYSSDRWLPANNVWVYFQLIPPDPKDVANKAPNPTADHAEYIKKVRQADNQADATAEKPQLCNASKSVGGKRDCDISGDNPVENIFEILTEDGGCRLGFHKADPKNADAFKKSRRTALEPNRERRDYNPAAKTDVVKNAVRAQSNDDGEAGVIFMPSRCGGDRYRIRAFVGPGTLDSDGTEIGMSHIVETGSLVVWRMVRVARFMEQKGPALDHVGAGDNSLIAKEYAKAYIKMIFDKTAVVEISDDDWKKAYGAARDKAINSTTLGARNVLHLDTLLPANPPTGEGFWIPMLTSAAYNAAVADRKFTHNATGRITGPPAVMGTGGALKELQSFMLNEMMRYYTDNGFCPGVTLIRSKSVQRLEYDLAINSQLGGMSMTWHGCYTFLNDAEYKSLAGPFAWGKTGANPTEAIAVHEAGHTWLMRHQFTNNNENDGAFVNYLHENFYAITITPAGNANFNAAASDVKKMCNMSYHPDIAGEFCGKCLLSLSGWNIRKVAEPA
ncbi:MAG: peptidoglycan-binding protein [bacterium]|nr:peptidoglycan-binding protein [bacterium]